MATKSLPQAFSRAIGTATVNEKGQIVIPAEMRRRSGIAPGTRVVFWMEGEHIALQAVEKFVEELPAAFASARSLEDIRDKDHRRDKER